MDDEYIEISSIYDQQRMVGPHLDSVEPEKYEEHDIKIEFDYNSKHKETQDENTK